MRVIGPGQLVAAFGGRAPRQADELTQVAPALQVLRQNDNGAARQGELGPRQQLQAEFFGLAVGTHQAGHRAFVGHRQRRVAQRGSARHQLFGLRGTALEAEA